MLYFSSLFMGKTDGLDPDSILQHCKYWTLILLNVSTSQFAADAVPAHWPGGLPAAFFGFRFTMGTLIFVACTPCRPSKVLHPLSYRSISGMPKNLIFLDIVR
jgi:hypothetical protein